MIRLHLCSGDKVKAKNLEVNFLVVDITMAYNIILGRPTLYKGYTFSSSSLPSSSAVSSSSWSSPLTKGLKVAFLTEGWGQGHRDLAEELNTLLATLMIALLLGLGHFLSPRSYLGLSLGECLLQRALQGLLLGLQHPFLLPQLLLATWTNARALAEASPMA
ncbi:hypothetical protein Cgig2_012721 [Carnegiea gigantea]|uniref:Uncharacterized protein n=1 Tax=Carnegiea gigantea TaxID=171969 RepID=A0A9Q1GIL9_9CARY|nr:hypothetical protein Cgig2_012721 [Carnegiea gigantea]